MLGLDLAIIERSLRFLAGEAELPGSAELLHRLGGMMESLEAKAERAEEARVHTDEALATSQARAVLTVLGVRGLAVTDAERSRILAETDAERLERWLKRAVGAGSLAEVLAD